MPLKRCVALLAALLLAAVAQAAPAELPADGTWQRLGQGEARFIGLHLYAARLWVGAAGYAGDAPFALELEYARAFSRATLVDNSLAEMRRLGEADEARLARWKAALETVLPDVAAGERLVGVNMPGRGASFFHQGRACGEVLDPAFARAFFAIWLDPRARLPGLRAQLLGQR